MRFLRAYAQIDCADRRTAAGPPYAKKSKDRKYIEATGY